uniref:Uncharacterized protein n=1 Tax=Nelumbo nucifera TaxID=4432 RepID=A0A822XZL7_NELNU|nr:TPA_asm: hypothetical protein HUJ06_028562 [Nelumbo nucifera]
MYILLETGEQVKNMAQDAAEKVKNTLGMNTDGNSNNPGNLNNEDNPGITLAKDRM